MGPPIHSLRLPLAPSFPPSAQLRFVALAFVGLAGAPPRALGRLDMIVTFVVAIVHRTLS